MEKSLVCPETGRPALLDSKLHSTGEVVARYQHSCSECEWAMIVSEKQARHYFETKHLVNPTGGLYPSEPLKLRNSTTNEKD